MRTGRWVVVCLSAAALLGLGGCAQKEPPTPASGPASPYFGSSTTPTPTSTPTAATSAAPAPAVDTSAPATDTDPAARKAFTRAVEQYCVRFFLEQRHAEQAFPAPDLASQIGFASAAARSAQQLQPMLAALTAPADQTYTFAAFVENERKFSEARADAAASIASTGTEGVAGDALDAAIAARRPLAVTMHAVTCDGKLPPDQRREVVAALRTFETTDDSRAACADLATDGFLQTRWFDLPDPLEGCITSRQHNAEGGVGLPDDIVVSDVAGSDGIAATVHYALVGGCECGDDAVARLHHVDGRWLVSALGY